MVLLLLSVDCNTCFWDCYILSVSLSVICLPSAGYEPGGLPSQRGSRACVACVGIHPQFSERCEDKALWGKGCAALPPHVCCQSGSISLSVDFQCPVAQHCVWNFVNDAEVAVGVTASCTAYARLPPKAARIELAPWSPRCLCCCSPGLISHIATCRPCSSLGVSSTYWMHSVVRCPLVFESAGQQCRCWLHWWMFLPVGMGCCKLLHAMHGIWPRDMQCTYRVCGTLPGAHALDVRLTLE